MAGEILSHAQENNLGGSPGVESGAKQLARRARLLSDGLSGGRQLVANELDLLGVANGDGLAQMVRQKGLMRNSREAGGNFFIARAAHNPNNRSSRAMARTRRPYSSIDCGDPGDLLIMDNLSAH